MDRGVDALPIAAGSDHYLYEHENGLDDGSTVPASAIASHIESSQIDLGDGDQFAFLSRLYQTLRSATLLPTHLQLRLLLVLETFRVVNTYIRRRCSQRQPQRLLNSLLKKLNAVTGTVFNLKVESTATETTWRLGTPRVEVRPDGDANV